jgi:hypothetical protein
VNREKFWHARALKAEAALVEIGATVFPIGRPDDQWVSVQMAEQMRQIARDALAQVPLRNPASRLVRGREKGMKP